LAVVAFFGTGYGETADLSALVPAMLPAPVLAACGPASNGARYVINWLSSVPEGALFLVRASACDQGRSMAWIVRLRHERTRAVLPISGQFRLLASDSSYPLVESERSVSSGVVEVQRFMWRDGQYQLAARDRVYEIAGERCGNKAQCDGVARSALDDGQVAHALAIWHVVDQASWI